MHRADEGAEVLRGADALYIIDSIISTNRGAPGRVFSRCDTNLLGPHGRVGQRPVRFCLWLLLACARLAVGANTPHPIDLDRFDAAKKSVALPSGETLAYVSLGEEHGPPLVLIHGYTDNARDWVPLAPYLSAHRHLILVDLRGHGASSKPECCYTRFDFAYDIALLLDALHVPRADIAGHSLGSVIAQTFAEYWPQHTRRLILISSTARLWSQSGPQPAWVTEIRQLKEPVDPDSPFMVQWWSSPTPVDPDFLRRQRRDAAAIPLRVWRAVIDQALTDADLLPSLSRISAPTLLIWGGKDPLIPEDARKSLRDALPAAQVKVFEGLGHNPFWEQPQACADVMNAFLSAAPQGAARS
jgi:pimeloyl-ACP methyl ester carboxylesterase